MVSIQKCCHGSPFQFIFHFSFVYRYSQSPNDCIPLWKTEKIDFNDFNGFVDGFMAIKSRENKIDEIHSLRRPKVIECHHSIGF